MEFCQASLGLGDTGLRMRIHRTIGKRRGEAAETPFVFGEFRADWFDSCQATLPDDSTSRVASSEVGDFTTAHEANVLVTTCRWGEP